MNRKRTPRFLSHGPLRTRSRARRDRSTAADAGPEVSQEVFDDVTREELFVCVRKRMGFSTEEIARHLKKPADTVERLYFSAEAKIRRLLKG
jgi:DNA-directed RNA polymerase specialized sigma24 family protein